MKDGILLIDKPEGITSAKTVLKVKKILNVKKAGHTGTLDPFATGILIICFNSSTKLTSFFSNLDKSYVGTMVLGVSTDTQDLTGKITRVSNMKSGTKLNESDIKNAFDTFMGEIWQTPPMFSAVKYKGKPLYKLARRGKEVKVDARKVRIFQLSLLEIEPLSLDKFPTITFEVRCSKGTYIRTLCNDIGEYLGCGAYLTKLRRVKVDNISIDRSIPLNKFVKLSQKEQLEYIIPPERVLESLSDQNNYL